MQTTGGLAGDDVFDGDLLVRDDDALDHQA